MTYRNWLPSSWLGAREDDHPLTALRHQIDTLFEDFDKGFMSRDGGFAVRSNVSETDGEIRVTADLPGITEKDIDVSVSGNRLTVKGEKKSEDEKKDEKEGRTYHRVERYAGAFERTLALPFEIDAEQVSAEVKDGVLTVTVPKPPEAVDKPRKVKVKKAK